VGAKKNRTKSNYPITKFPNLLPSRYRRHYRNVITVANGGRLLLQVANVFVIQVNIDERAQLAVFSVEMAPEIGMIGDEPAQGFSDGRTFHVNRRLLAGILPQRRGDMDLRHG
jgi:hypothetical protein